MTVALLVDEDVATREHLAAGLTKHGFEVHEAGTAAEALSATELDEPDVVVVDLSLPDLKGVAVLRTLRGVSQVPVLVMTDRCDENSDHVIRLLNCGADDYLVKPLQTDEITIRINDALRKRAVRLPKTGVITVGELRIDLGRHTASLGERDLDLTCREFHLLAYLADREGSVVPQKAIMRDIWHHSRGGLSRSITNYIGRLRAKLGESGTQPHYLHTIRGAGFMMKCP
jgi:DNA-binding response OmpR family regulator